MASIRDLLRGGRPDPGDVARHTVGNALVLHHRDEISGEAQDLALSVVADADNDVVILDLGSGMSINSWESMAGVLPRRRRGIRLVTCGQRHDTAAMAGQWLSERLNRTVIAPDGDLVRGAAGALFVHSKPGSGWVRFRPGKPPAWESKRYPTPSWDAAATERRPSSSTGEIEPLPGGVWIHDVRVPQVTDEHRRRLVVDVPCQPETMTVLLGCPGTAPLALDDVVRFWRELDVESQLRTRFVRYGDVRMPAGETFGQTLADLLGTNVVCYTGVPIGAPGKVEIRTVRADGVLGWPPFALELGYVPRAHPNSRARRPVVLSHRGPLPDAEEISPRVYWYAPDAVVEVVEAGLWIRPVDEPGNAERIRGSALDPESATMVFDDTEAGQAARMRELAEDLTARVDGNLGQITDLVAASVLVPELRPAGRAHAVLTSAPDRPGDRHPSGAEPTVITPRPHPISVTTVVAIAQPPAPAIARTEPAAEAALGAAPSVAEAALGSAPSVAQASLGSAPTLRLPRPMPESLVASSALPAEGRVGPGAPSAIGPVADESGAPRPDVPGQPPGTPSIDLPPPPPPAPIQIPTESSIEVPDPGAEPAGIDGSAGSAPAPDAAGMDSPVATAVGPVDAKESAPVSASPGVRLQPVAGADSAALLPRRGITEERAWLRRSLSRDFDVMASSVSRIMSEHPGMKSAGAGTPDDVLVDSVAARLFLTARGVGVDAGLRTGVNGPHVPFARCAVSGLSRLPSFRGSTVARLSPLAEEWAMYRERNLVSDWSFVTMLTAPCAAQVGDTDLLIWSMTARRTALLEPEGDDHVDDRVVFLPGTHFKILELREPDGGRRGSILLRELGTNEVDEDGRVDPNRLSLDELAVTSMRRSIERWTGTDGRRRVGHAATGRFGTLPGLLRPSSEEGR
ncbi:hypothetical protein O7608_15775 [Solwaraspora sp. WMMA2056]|uniref:hypothetical protein n=1 Tax=Solwaraspora sp. WMMA2056 TaxID=3015161 RepID=UPI00259B5920|nr:hypothetical protein [Solwaraspora sp. WMMA2056]WJK43736.1 hypothetical protein O7608_15775 [Solwaraspora sp. WMMA2056]